MGKLKVKESDSNVMQSKEQQRLTHCQKMCRPIAKLSLPLGAGSIPTGNLKISTMLSTMPEIDLMT